jgi:signal transduction histidine kinase
MGQIISFIILIIIVIIILFIYFIYVKSKNEISRLSNDLYCEKLKMGEILSNIEDGIIFTDINSTVTHINPVIEKALGIEEKLLIGMPSQELLKIIREKIYNTVGICHNEDAILSDLNIPSDNNIISYNA